MPKNNAIGLDDVSEKTKSQWVYPIMHITVQLGRHKLVC